MSKTKSELVRGHFAAFQARDRAVMGSSMLPKTGLRFSGSQSGQFNPPRKVS